MEKLEFMEEMFEVRDLHVGPWTIIGDFNFIMNLEHKNNSSINRRMMAWCPGKINLLELKEMYLNKIKYMWSNERGNVEYP